MFREEWVFGEPGRDPVQMDQRLLGVLFEERGELEYLQVEEMA